MYSNLENKTAFVTGASRGLGESIAYAFAKAGSDLVIVSRNQAALDEVAQNIKDKYPIQVLPLATDVSIRKDGEKTLEEALRVFGKIDILVNNAGVNVKKNFFDITEDEWDYVLNINLKGIYICSQVIGKQLVKQGGGKVVNMASFGSQFALLHSSAYCASKGGLVQLTKVLALEWAPYNINVNAVAPGYIETEMVKEAMRKMPDMRETILKRTPMKRFCRPEEVASAVVFLSSDEANFITGIVLSVDGGMTAQGI